MCLTAAPRRPSHRAASEALARHVRFYAGRVPADARPMAEAAGAVMLDQAGAAPYPMQMHMLLQFTDPHFARDAEYGRLRRDWIEPR